MPTRRCAAGAAARAFARATPWLLATATAACGVPPVVQPYRMEVQQGNYVSQEMVAQLRRGMTREQVRFLLGTPLLADPFRDNRWDYLYYRDTPKGREQRRITILFEGDSLERVIGDVVPASEAKAP